MRNTKGRILTAALTFILLSFTFMQKVEANDPDFTITPPTMKYLMAFHGCAGSNCQDPRNHEVYLAQSNDGLNYSLVPGWKPYPGSVPTVFRRGNTIFIYNAWTNLRKIDVQTGVVHDAGIAKLTGNLVGIEQGGFVDPSIAQGSDGRFVMFYLPTQANSDPAGCGSQSTCVREIHYAEEVAGSGGTRFDDKGIAASKNLTSPNTFSDPDIFFNGSKWVLIVSEGPSVEAFTSPTLQSSYTSAGVISKNSGGVPAGFRDPSSGQIWIFTTKDVDTAGSSVIRRTVTSTGTEELSKFDVVIDSNIYQGKKLTTIASPSLAINNEGSPCPTCAGNNNGNSGQQNNQNSNQQSASPTPTVSSTPSPTASTKASSAPSPTPKSVTITCIKGKLTKKVTGTSPKCPSGYVKK